MSMFLKFNKLIHLMLWWWWLKLEILTLDFCQRSESSFCGITCPCSSRGPNRLSYTGTVSYWLILNGLRYCSWKLRLCKKCIKILLYLTDWNYVKILQYPSSWNHVKCMGLTKDNDVITGMKLNWGKLRNNLCQMMMMQILIS